jgi:hypothetical protein
VLNGLGGVGEMARDPFLRHAALKQYHTEGVEMDMEMDSCAFFPCLSAWIAAFTECVLIFAMSIYVRMCSMCVRLDSVL